MLQDELLKLLHQGLRSMNQSLDQHLELKLIRYIEIIFKKNKSTKLSSIHDQDTMVKRHLLDSLSILPLLAEGNILDVGTGIGLPGIPLSIASPKRYFFLLDSKDKKIQFLHQIVQYLSLQNVCLTHQRIEDFHFKPLFDSIVTRSFGTLKELTTLTHHLLKPGGQLLAMKGIYPLTELQDIYPAFKLVAVHPLKVPGFSDPRHVVELARTETFVSDAETLL